VAELSLDLMSFDVAPPGPRALTNLGRLRSTVERQGGAAQGGESRIPVFHFRTRASSSWEKRPEQGGEQGPHPLGVMEGILLRGIIGPAYGLSSRFVKGNRKWFGAATCASHMCRRHEQDGFEVVKLHYQGSTRPNKKNRVPHPNMGRPEHARISAMPKYAAGRRPIFRGDPIAIKGGRGKRFFGRGLGRLPKGAGRPRKRGAAGHCFDGGR